MHARQPMRSSAPPPFVTAPADSFHRCVDFGALARTLRGPLPADPRSRIVGPHDLHVLHELRRRHRIAGPDQIPADFFVWATGEPPHPAMTKLGGAPFLPRSRPWPERDGTVGDFAAQLCFVDSRHLVPPLPGDVLLVFCFHDLDCTSWERRLYEFVWVDVQEQELTPLAAVRHSQNGARAPTPAFFGYRVRSYDVPGQVERVRTDPSIPDCGLHNAAVAKIGGAATDAQSVWQPEVPADWRFLGQITGIWPAVGVPWPVVDREAPVAAAGTPEYQALMHGPGDGITCLYLDGRGEVQVRFSCG